MKIPIADLLDRFSILEIKRAHTEEALPEYSAYADCVETTIKEWLSKGIDLSSQLDALRGINAAIWKLESSLRLSQEGSYDLGSVTNLDAEQLRLLAAVGLVAISVRDKNRTRKAIMADVVQTTGEGWEDIKINHLSTKSTVSSDQPTAF